MILLNKYRRRKIPKIDKSEEHQIYRSMTLTTFRQGSGAEVGNTQISCYPAHFAHLNRDVTLDFLKHSKHCKKKLTHGFKYIFTAALLKSRALEKEVNWSNRHSPFQKKKKKRWNNSTFLITKLSSNLSEELFSSHLAPQQHSPHGCINPHASFSTSSVATPEHFKFSWVFTWA